MSVASTGSAAAPVCENWPTTSFVFPGRCCSPLTPAQVKMCAESMIASAAKNPPVTSSLLNNVTVVTPKKQLSERETWLEAVKVDWRAYNILPSEFTDDIEIMSAGFTYQFGFEVLRYASTKLQKNREFFLKALANSSRGGANLPVPKAILESHDLETLMALIKIRPHALLYMPKTVKSNKEFVMVAVRDHKSPLEGLSDQLLDDKEIVLLAVRNSGWDNLRCASDRLQDDPDVVLAATANDRDAHSSAFQFASKRLKNDFEFALKVVTQSPQSSYYLSEMLKKDPIFNSAVKASMQKEADSKDMKTASAKK